MPFDCTAGVTMGPVQAASVTTNTPVLQLRAPALRHSLLLEWASMNTYVGPAHPFLTVLSSLLQGWAPQVSNPWLGACTSPYAKSQGISSGPDGMHPRRRNTLAVATSTMKMQINMPTVELFSKPYTCTHVGFLTRHQRSSSPPIAGR